LLDGCEEGVEIEMENRGLASHGSHSAAWAATRQTSPVVVRTMFGFSAPIAQPTLATQL
jgi:hypothetical protein